MVWALRGPRLDRRREPSAGSTPEGSPAHEPEGADRIRRLSPLGRRAGHVSGPDLRSGKPQLWNAFISRLGLATTRKITGISGGQFSRPATRRLSSARAGHVPIAVGRELEAVFGGWVPPGS